MERQTSILIILLLSFITGVIIILLSNIKLKTKPSKNKKDDKKENTGKDPIIPVNDWIKKHNFYRSKVGYPGLNWSEELAQQSERYAKQLNSSGEFKHGDYNNSNCFQKKCGQNLEKTIGVNASVNAVDNWYNECNKYTGKFSEDAGHYTQLIWKDAKKVGCASVGTIAACLYDKGNILGEFVENVPEMGSC